MGLETLVDSWRGDGQPRMRVVGFVDDDPLLHGQVLNGLTIYSPTDLVGLAEALRISDVLLALPTASRKRRNSYLH
jgi:FlaA1/EpsC-like NDP-sugar epimerase